MIQLNAGNEHQCKGEAIILSLDNPQTYVTVFVDFGTAFAALNQRLNVHAPTDSTFNWYALNGKLRTFTKAQAVADQNATPTLS
jgi:hypothetical protein